MTRYAEKTTVSSEQTRAQLDRLLEQHGATQRATFVDDAKSIAIVAFAMHGRQVKFELHIPSVHEIKQQAERNCPRGWRGWTPKQRDAWCVKARAQIERARWRALLQMARMKLEFIADGISTFEREFLTDIMLPDGRRVGEALEPQIAAAYSTGKMPPLLGK